MALFLALSGFMGSGKSVVGAAVAERLGWRFWDLDEEVEALAGAEVATIFAERGEPAFRAIESRALEDVIALASERDALVALGGGTLEDPANRLLLQKTGSLVFLDVTTELAWERSAGSGRPLARDEDAFVALWRSRRPTYVSSASWVVPVGGRDVEAVACAVGDLVVMGASAWPSLWGRQLVSTSTPSLIVGGIGALSVLPWEVGRSRASGSRLHVITDSNVMKAQGKRLLCALEMGNREEVLVLQPGESSKNAAELGMCWNWLAERRALREDVVVAMGGGVVGDLAGFAAATYQRGVAVWQIPTTLIAQVDSSVGGKTAINLEVGKNLVGAFHQPALVVIDPDVLMTLSADEYTGGLGEVVKHAVLASEEDLEWLEKNSALVRRRDAATLSELGRRDVWFKAGVVEEDERESGCRAMLNLGHTTAHALEATLGYGRMNHGQAVALGLLVSMAVSEELLGLDRTIRERTGSLLRELGLQVSAGVVSREALVRATMHDKKTRSDSSGFVGLRALGKPVWGVDVSAEVLGKALEVITK